MTIPNWYQTMYGWDNVTLEVKTYPHNPNTYWNGNSACGNGIVNTVSSGRILKTSAGTLKANISPYVKNDGTYIRLSLRGNGYTTSLQGGNYKLYFSDGWSGTIEQAIAAGYIDPIVFKYTGNNTYSFIIWDLSNIFTGGLTNTKSYPNCEMWIRPLEEKEITHWEFYTNIGLNATYDGYYIYQTNISKLGTTPEEVSPPAYNTSGTRIIDGIDISTFPDNASIRWEEELPSDTTITVETAIMDGTDEPIEEDWEEQTNFSTITNWPVTRTDKKLWARITLTTVDTNLSPAIYNFVIADAIDYTKILLTMADNGRFTRAEGQLNVEYTAAAGNLSGVGGPVQDFEINFSPADLEYEHNNPGCSEVIGTEIIGLVITRSEISFTKNYPEESIGAELLELAIVRTHIDDIDP